MYALRTLLEVLPPAILMGGAFGFTHEMRKERRDRPPYVNFWTDFFHNLPPDALFIPRRGVLTPLGWRFWWLRMLCMALAVAYVFVAAYR